MGTQHRMTDFPSGMDAERTYIHAPCCLIRSCFSIQPRLPQLHVFKRCAAACCFYLLAAAALSCTGTEKEKMQTLILSIESHTTGEAISITVETAITVDEQQRGFMHRDDIPDGTGMIFIYKSDTRLRFWMKDTPPNPQQQHKQNPNTPTILDERHPSPAFHCLYRFCRPHSGNL